MAYFERLRGNYENAASRLDERRVALINRAKELQPFDMDELLENNEDGELDYPLDWVEIPYPWEGISDESIKVRPILGIHSGYEDAEREKDRSDKGVWKIGILSELPNGDVWYMGDTSFFLRDGLFKQEPMISLNFTPTDSHFGSDFVSWDSTDAEVFLTLTEAALERQS